MINIIYLAESEVTNFFLELTRTQSTTNDAQIIPIEISTVSCYICPPHAIQDVINNLIIQIISPNIYVANRVHLNSNM